ncbi:MAG: hypothetical protein BHV88_21440 [Clostridiales bacterium 41_12_two_minus]|nr:MAG: hypothetical protein BHV88_21440 [Clostridiales bacterium 41_12_two_minus]
MGEVIKSYKGFNKNMTCRGFQYEEGKEYEEEIVEVCDHGFHVCEYPLDCLNYYYPNESVYHEVEQSGEIQEHNDDTKVASTKIKIGAEISIAGLVKAAIEYTVKRVKKDAESDEKHGASSATGYCGASSATGYKGASSATGYKGASSATGDYGASSATGTCGASSATGYCGASSAEDKDAVAVAWGYKSKAKGVLGAFLVFADWEYTGSEDDTEYDRNNQSAWVLNGAKMVQVDGENIKPNTWYTIENGEIAEVSE